MEDIKMEHIEYLHVDEIKQRWSRKRKARNCKETMISVYRTVALVFNDDWSEVLVGDCRTNDDIDKYVKSVGNKIAYDRAKSNPSIHMTFGKFLEILKNYIDNQTRISRMLRKKGSHDLDIVRSEYQWYELLVFLDNQIHKRYVKNFKDLPGTLVFRVLKVYADEYMDEEVLKSFDDIDYRSEWQRSMAYYDKDPDELEKFLKGDMGTTSYCNYEIRD